MVVVTASLYYTMSIHTHSETVCADERDGLRLSGWQLLLMLINHKHNNGKGVENYFFNHSQLRKSDKGS